MVTKYKSGWGQQASSLPRYHHTKVGAWDEVDRPTLTSHFQWMYLTIYNPSHWPVSQ